MDFASVIAVLLTYFIRPQDSVPGLSGVNIVQPIMAIALLGMFMRRRGFSGGSLFQTPLDWAITAYGIYICLTAPDSYAAAKGVLILLAFYFVTSQALVTQRRLEIFLNCWFGALLTIALMAVASEYGLDLTGAFPLTHSVPNDPRLVLNTYLLNNPNALGHTVILALPLAYFILFWKTSGGKKLLAIAVMAVAGYCVYLTKSKGAYIAGFVVIAVSLLLGRHRIFQVVIICLAATLGWAALTQLPRMEQLSSSARQDEAILGRLLAWEMARTASRENPTGVGWQEFEAYIRWEDQVLLKATHSSYVRIGADLGTYGMFFFIGVLYCCLRSLFSNRFNDVTDERSRRILIVLVVGYMASNWMIDRAYHLEYFLMAGAVSALHRRRGVETEILEPLDLTEEEIELEPHWVTRSRNLDHDDEPIALPEEVDTSAVVEEAIEEEMTRRRFWRRISPLDLVAAAALAWTTFWFWDYILENL